MPLHPPLLGFLMPLTWLARLSRRDLRPLERRTAPSHGDQVEAPAPAAGARALDAPLGARPDGALGEDAFHALLAVERARADRSGRRLRLVLVGVRSARAKAVALKAAAVSRLFAGLRDAVRETDIVGWYREGRVAAAVLVELDDATAREASPLVRQRVLEALHRRLPARTASLLWVRVTRVRTRAATRRSPAPPA